MNKKVGRPASNNVPYFPHYTETSNELMFLERKHDAEGYRAYYRLFEMVSKAEHHHIIIKTENQKLTFIYETIDLFYTGVRFDWYLSIYPFYLHL